VPPGVEHDIPVPGQDLAQRSDWEGAVEGACRRAELAEDCLVLTYDIRAIPPEGGDPEPINDPGSMYVGDKVYGSCDVQSVVPPTGESVTIPAGTQITVHIVCTPYDPEDD
jgi:hypothetical protein